MGERVNILKGLMLGLAMACLAAPAWAQDTTAAESGGLELAIELPVSMTLKNQSDQYKEVAGGGLSFGGGLDWWGLEGWGNHHVGLLAESYRLLPSDGVSNNVVLSFLGAQYRYQFGAWSLGGGLSRGQAELAPLKTGFSTVAVFPIDMNKFNLNFGWQTGRYLFFINFHNMMGEGVIYNSGAPTGNRLNLDGTYTTLGVAVAL